MFNTMFIKIGNSELNIQQFEEMFRACQKPDNSFTLPEEVGVAVLNKIRELYLENIELKDEASTKNS